MRVVAIICFFLSGSSGLIFEIIWSRMFSLVFGATTLAISTVLTAFMGGLALGSFLAGRIADRIKDPLRAYAVAEAGIGATALLLPLVVGTFDSLNQFLYLHFKDNYLLLVTIRFLASASVMVIPTTLMGATLPLLSRFYIQDQNEQSRIGLRVGTLYAVNTFGALIGTCLGGMVLLPTLGLSQTNQIAATINISLALVVVLAYEIRRRLPAPSPLDQEIEALLEKARPIPPVKPDVSPLARRFTLVGFAISGGIAMVYQVIWTRALFISHGSSVYSFTIVLSTFLVGLAGGAATIGKLASGSRNPVGWLAINHITIAILVGLSYLLIDQLPFMFLFLLKGEEIGAQVVLWSQFLISLLVMLPATFAMGGILPLTIRIYASDLDKVGREVGSAYSINTIGAIVGSFLSGFLIIPVFQLQPGLYTSACINLLLAVALGLVSSWKLKHKVICVTVAVTLAITGLSLPRWNLAHVSSGLFRISLAQNVLKTGRWRDPKLVFYRDGISTTVSVEQWSTKHFSLKNNGKVDASTDDDMPTQIAVGLLPILIHPKAPDLRPDVVLIGFASGVTAGSILQYPVRHLDVVELEPAIMEASKFFQHVNNRPLLDQRITVITDDGRNFLAAGTKKYDVIINEPSNPWITGVSNLFTKAYFEIGRRRLKKDGIFCTWAQMYEIAPRRIKSIYKTFSEVFPYTYAFSAEALSSDTFLIGTNQPLRLDYKRLLRAFKIRKVRDELLRAKIKTPSEIIALTLLGPKEVKAFSAGARINTDDNALLEFRAPIDLFNHRRYDYYISKVYGQGWIYGRLQDFITGFSTSEDYASLVRSLLVNGKFREANVFFKKVKKNGGPLSLHVHYLMRLLGSREQTEKEVSLTGEGPPLEPPKLSEKILKSKDSNRISREYFIVEQRTRAGAFRAALDLIEEWPDSFEKKAGHDFHLLWGYLVYKCLDFHTAVKILEPLWKEKRFVKRRPALLYYLGRSFYGNADFSKSIDALEQWITHRTKVKKFIVPPLKVATGAMLIDLMPE